MQQLPDIEYGNCEWHRFLREKAFEKSRRKKNNFRLMVDILRHLGELGKIVKNGKIPEYFDLTVNS